MELHTDMFFIFTSFLYFIPMIAIAILVPVMLIKKVRAANPDRETLLKEYPFLQMGNPERRIRRVQVAAFIVMAISLIATVALAVVLDFSDFNQIPLPLLISFGALIAGAGIFAVTTITVNTMQRIRYMKYGYYDL